MSIILSIFGEKPFISLPTTWVGWVGLVFWLGLILFIMRHYWQYQKPLDNITKQLFVVLLILVPITSFFFGIRLPVWDFNFNSDIIELGGYSLMILSAVPWVFAAGFIGPLQAAILAGLSGTIIGLWDTHSPFTGIEYMLLAVLIYALISQVNRASKYNRLSEPFVTTYLLSFIYPVIFSLSTIFYIPGPLSTKFDYLVSKILFATLAVDCPLLIAGLLAETIKNSDMVSWGNKTALKFRVKEFSLENNYIKKMLAISLSLIILLFAGEWFVVRNETQRMLKNQMISGSEITIGAFPGFLEVGNNRISSVAENLSTYTNSIDDIQYFLNAEIQEYQFFQQFNVFDINGNFVTGFPVTTLPSDYNLSEQGNYDKAPTDTISHWLTLSEVYDDKVAQVIFQAPIEDLEGNITAFVVGSTTFADIKLATPIIAGLNFLEAVGGKGFIVDIGHDILYTPKGDLPFNQEDFSAIKPNEFVNEVASDGTQQITYYAPVENSSWFVGMILPSRTIQQLAINNLFPVAVVVGLVLISVVLLMRTSFKSMTTSMKSLAIKTNEITRERLIPEIGKDLAYEENGDQVTFEQMRNTLKTRLDELNHLLAVSQGVASSMNMENASVPILESALTIGAKSARIVLKPSMMPVNILDSEIRSRFGVGESRDTYKYLDDQILTLMEHHKRIVMSNPGRTTLLNFDPGDVKPESILSTALYHEDQYFGSLWIAYDTPHTFSEEEVRFITTLSGQAALAAAKNRLFWTAEFERQRLTAILASTPDPVIVTDQRDNLLLLNPAAEQVLGIREIDRIGNAIEDSIPHIDLVKLIKSTTNENKSIELVLSDRRFYLATASSIVADNKPFGKVCILRDVTNFKELDALKSEFVATVSHDLRSPLTLLSGYANMLEMVGGLNEQQETYVNKIMDGINSMSKLINNLLDLGRIEADIKLQLETLLVTDLIEEVTESLQLKANQKRLKINIEIPQHESLLVEADHAMLHQAFYNLLENAIKYSTDGKEINLKVESEKENIRFSFQDFGIGISPVDNPRLFEKFFRSANRDTIKDRGTGLGLAIVKSIADRHGGRVWVDSQLGKGSTFYFELPRSQAYKRRKTTG